MKGKILDLLFVGGSILNNVELMTKIGLRNTHKIIYLLGGLLVTRRSFSVQPF